MDLEGVAGLAFLGLALVGWIVAWRQERGWEGYKRWREQIDVFGKAEKDREQRRKDGAGPWEV